MHKAAITPTSVLSTSPDWVMIVLDESHRFEVALEFILTYDWD